jgi:hypothetical protein
MACSANRLDTFRAYSDALQAAWHSEAADEAVQHVGGVLSRRASVLSKVF